MSGSLTFSTCFSTIICTINRMVSRGMGCDKFVWCGNTVRPDSTEWDILGYPWANSNLLCSTIEKALRNQGFFVFCFWIILRFCPFAHKISTKAIAQCRRNACISRVFAVFYLHRIGTTPIRPAADACVLPLPRSFRAVHEHTDQWHLCWLKASLNMKMASNMAILFSSEFPR